MCVAQVIDAAQGILGKPGEGMGAQQQLGTHRRPTAANERASCTVLRMMAGKFTLVGLAAVLTFAACSLDDVPATSVGAKAGSSLYVDGLGHCESTIGRDQLKAVLYAISDLGNNVPLIRRVFEKASKGQKTIRIPVGQGVGGGHSRIPIDGPFTQAIGIAAHARKGLIRAFSKVCSDVPDASRSSSIGADSRR